MLKNILFFLMQNKFHQNNSPNIAATSNNTVEITKGLDYRNPAFECTHRIVHILSEVRIYL